MMFEWYPAYEDQLARVQLILFMLGMGATLSARDFIEIVRRPRSFFVALAGQLLVIPWLAVLINHLFQLEAGIALGLILVAAMPGGTISKVVTYLGRGNVALSISLTAFTTLASLVYVPVLLSLLAREYLPEDFEMPAAAIIQELVLCLLLPLIGGLVLARLVPYARKGLSRWCVRVGLFVVVVMIVGSLGSGRIQPGAYGWKVPIAIILFCLAGQQLNMIPFRLLGWPRQDRMAAGIEVTMRNINLALLLKARFFPGSDAIANGVLFVSLYYAAVAMGAGLPLALNHRRLARRETKDAQDALPIRST